MLRTYTIPVFGLAAVLPQFAPPTAPGCVIVALNWDNGVNNPVCILSIFRFQSSRSSGVRKNGVMSADVISCLANGGTTVGNGCVGHASSPGKSLGGTGRSSIGQSGSPVTRLNTNRKPCFDANATASIDFPPWFTVINCGAAEGS